MYSHVVSSWYGYAVGIRCRQHRAAAGGGTMASSCRIRTCFGLPEISPQREVLFAYGAVLLLAAAIASVRGSVPLVTFSTPIPSPCSAVGQCDNGMICVATTNGTNFCFCPIGYSRNANQTCRVNRTFCPTWNVTRGQVMYTNRQAPLSMAILVCNKGYEPITAPSALCNASSVMDLHGQWSNGLVCQRIGGVPTTSYIELMLIALVCVCLMSALVCMFITVFNSKRFQACWRSLRTMKRTHNHKLRRLDRNLLSHGDLEPRASANRSRHNRRISRTTLCSSFETQISLETDYDSVLYRPNSKSSPNIFNANRDVVVVRRGNNKSGGKGGSPSLPCCMLDHMDSHDSPRSIGSSGRLHGRVKRQPLSRMSQSDRQSSDSLPGVQSSRSTSSLPSCLRSVSSSVHFSNSCSDDSESELVDRQYYEQRFPSTAYMKKWSMIPAEADEDEDAFSDVERRQSSRSGKRSSQQSDNTLAASRTPSRIHLDDTIYLRRLSYTQQQSTSTESVKVSKPARRMSSMPIKSSKRHSITEHKTPASVQLSSMPNKTLPKILSKALGNVGPSSASDLSDVDDFRASMLVQSGKGKNKVELQSQGLIRQMSKRSPVKRKIVLPVMAEQPYHRHLSGTVSSPGMLTISRSHPPPASRLLAVSPSSSLDACSPIGSGPVKAKSTRSEPKLDIIRWLSSSSASQVDQRSPLPTKSMAVKALPSNNKLRMASSSAHSLRAAFSATEGSGGDACSPMTSPRYTLRRSMPVVPSTLFPRHGASGRSSGNDSESDGDTPANIYHRTRSPPAGATRCFTPLMEPNEHDELNNNSSKYNNRNHRNTAISSSSKKAVHNSNSSKKALRGNDFCLCDASDGWMDSPLELCSPTVVSGILSSSCDDLDSTPEITFKPASVETTLSRHIVWD